jgi:hypothetical protein
VLVRKPSKSIDSFLLEGSVARVCSLCKRSHNSSPATGILPLSPMRLPAAELNQRCCRMRLLLNGRGVELPDELRCLTLDGLFFKRGSRRSSCKGGFRRHWRWRRWNLRKQCEHMVDRFVAAG